MCLSRGIFCLTLLTGCWIAALSCVPSYPSQSVEWRQYGGAAGDRFSPLDQINRSNVARLETAWTYSTGDLELMRQAGLTRSTAFECTPLMVNGVLYISTASNRVIALDATTGREIWTFDSQAGSEEREFNQQRGVAYWEGEGQGGPERRIFAGTFDGRLICLDASEGRPCPDFGKGGSLDLRQGMAQEGQHYALTSPPAVFRDLVITGAQVPEGPALGPSGDVRAFDARTGRQVWRFHTVPRPGQSGHDTWESGWEGRTGANVWSIMTVDVERGLIFLPTGSPAYDFWGGDRPGHNLFGNSLVALEAATGELRWYYQLVHHDIWDYDLPAPPVLVTVQREGKEVAAVAQVTKMGLVFLFDRENGRPLFEIEERPVPPSRVPGEAASPTQPFPVKPPPLSRQTGVDFSDLHDLGSPESRRHCEDMLRQAERIGGTYEPADTVLTLSFPGTLGGATWSGASFDPESGYLFVNVNEIGRIGRMEPSDKGGYRRASPWGSYARFWDSLEWPCQKPPWGVLHAVDLNSGELAWSVPLGMTPELEQRGIPRTGTPNLGGSIATGGGLVFIAGSRDRRLRAFDVQDGRELWAGELEASGHATPMTYLLDDRQYLVIAAGGGGYFSQDKAGDLLMAFALPR